MKYKNTRKISVEVSGFMDKEEGLFKFNYIHFVEKLGGPLPSGELQMEYTGKGSTLKRLSFLNTATVTITDDNKRKDDSAGRVYKFPIIIINKVFLKRLVTFNFVVCKKKSFFDKYITKEWESGTDIDDVISELLTDYIGKKPTEADTKEPWGKHFRNVSPTISIPEIGLHLIHLSNHDFLVPILQAYKLKIVFGFSIDGVILKEFPGINSFGEQEPSEAETFAEDIDHMQLLPMLEMDDQSMYESPYNPWEDIEKSCTETDYSELQSFNLRVQYNYGQYRFVHKDCLSFIENLEYNLNFNKPDTKGFMPARTYYDGLANWRIGDVVKYKKFGRDKENPGLIWPTLDYLITSCEFFYALDGADKKDIAGKKCSTITNFACLLDMSADFLTLPDENPGIKNSELGDLA